MGRNATEEARQYAELALRMSRKQRTVYPSKKELLSKEMVRLPLHFSIGEGMGGSPVLGLLLQRGPMVLTG